MAHDVSGEGRDRKKQTKVIFCFIYLHFVIEMGFGPLSLATFTASILAMLMI